ASTHPWRANRACRVRPRGPPAGCRPAAPIARAEGATRSCANQTWVSFVASFPFHPYITLAVSGKAPRTSDEPLVFNGKLARAERAVDANDAFLIAHLAPIFLRKARQDFLEVHHRTAASAREMRQRLHANLRFLVEEPPHQRFGRQVGIEQFLVPDRLREYRDMLPLGPVRPGM